MRTFIALLLIAPVLACGDTDTRGATAGASAGSKSTAIDSTTSSTTAPEHVTSNCGRTNPADTLDELRSTEDSALACWRALVRRAGDTLVLTRVGQPEIRLIDNHADDLAAVSYRFRGAVVRRYWVVDVQGYETGHTHIFDITGTDDVAFVSPPAVAPNGQYLAASSRSLDVAEAPTRLEIWRVTAGAPVLDFELDPFNPAEPGEGWGPGDVRWRTADTLVVPRYRADERANAGEVLRDTVRIVRTSTGWHIGQR